MHATIILLWVTVQSLQYILRVGGAQRVWTQSDISVFAFAAACLNGRLLTASVEVAVSSVSTGGAFLGPSGID